MPFLGTQLQVTSVDGLSRMMVQTTRTRAGMCLFGCCWCCFPLRGQIPQNRNFGGVNRRFQAKLAKSKNTHIIRTTASIPTKFCKVIKTTKCPSRVVRTHAAQIWRRPPSWKNWKIAISRPQFDRFRRNLAWRHSLALLSVPTVKISKI